MDRGFLIVFAAILGNYVPLIRLYLVLILFLLGPTALTTTACLAKSADNSPRLFGGLVTNWGEYPSVVSIDSPYNIHCIGNIVNNQHVVTSAQCVLNATYHTINPFWLTIIAGDINLAPRSFRREVRNVSAIFVHPNYNPFTLFNDLAVLRLDRPYVFPSNTIQAATRSTRIIPVGTICQMVGWGAATAVNLTFKKTIKKTQI
jgi:trypsin